ncbi:MAG: histone deacetylase [bacterium]
MSKTAIVADPVFMDHDTGPGHPERPERLERIYSYLEEKGLMDSLEKVPLREAEAEEICRIHTPEHLERVKATSGEKRFYMDGDTPTSADSYQTALLAAGSVLNATDAVVSGEVENAFALVRPPGHHAERQQAMGFCLFNNIAIAARHARERHGISRVLIVDWDVHHGNGTQHSFYDDPGVLYFSTHRFPFYPGSGAFSEIGEKDGKGYTVNIPLPAGCGDSIYNACFTHVLAPVARSFQPELLMVSAGFDTHQLDPLGGMRVSEQGFAGLMGIIQGLARELCNGKVLLTLEGGYHLEAQARSVAEVLSVCNGDAEAPSSDLPLPEGFEKVVQEVKDRLGGIWPGIGESQ